MESVVKKLSERFFNQSLNGEMNMDEMVSLYASGFIAASPAGVMAGENDGQLRQAKSTVLSDISF